MPKVNIDIYSRLHRSEKKLKEVEDRLKGVEQGAKKADSSLKGLWKQVAAGVGIGFGIPALTRGVGKLAGSFMEAAVETENYKVRLEALLGSQEKATEAMEFFEEVASKVPFTLQEVIGSGTQLTAFGLNFKKWTPVLNDLAAVMGMRLPEAASALGRAFAGGAGAADIFRERGILQIIKDFARMEKGIGDITKISLPEFREVMFETFTDTEGRVAGASDKLSTTWTGMVSMLSDAWFQFRKDIMEAGVFDMMKEGLQKVLDWVKKFKEEGGFDETALKISALGEAIGYVGKEIKRDTVILEMLFDILSGDKKRTDELTESNKRAAEAWERLGYKIFNTKEQLEAAKKAKEEIIGPTWDATEAYKGFEVSTEDAYKSVWALNKALRENQQTLFPYIQLIEDTTNAFGNLSFWPEKLGKDFQDTHHFIGEAIFDTKKAGEEQLTTMDKIATAMSWIGSFSKETAIASAIMNTYQGASKTIAMLGMPWAIPFVALAIATGMKQVAAIQAQSVPSADTGAYLPRDMLVQAHRDEFISPRPMLKETFREVIREPGGGGSLPKVQVFIGNREIKDFVVKTVNEDEDIVLRTGKLQ